jgi:DNA polymerase III epsilon subunit-like protein
MIKIVADFEANSKNALHAEILSGYFINLDTGETYDFRSQINNWSDEAEEIHGITENEMYTYPAKDYAFDQLLKWLPNEFEMIVYANANSEIGYQLYDVTLLRMNLLDHLNLDRIEHLPVNIHGYSVHTLAKQLDKAELISVNRNPTTNRKSFTQLNVFMSLFCGEVYDAHNAEADTTALCRLYKKLVDIKESGKSVADKQQLDLF